ncbi:extensin family protein [Aurantimonas sp. A2-1-M11]|uniref:extensin-like domain-containing protein n=1 Tax=Aurantimonas sp. A2-1-M11 TaxID=3113712 RepID=UPI002F9281E7
MLRTDTGSPGRILSLRRRLLDVSIPALVAAMLAAPGPVVAQAPDAATTQGEGAEAVPLPASRPDEGDADAPGADSPSSASSDDDKPAVAATAAASAAPPPSPESDEAATMPDPALTGEEAAERPVTAIPLPERRPAGSAGAAPAAPVSAQPDERATPEELRAREPAITPAAAVEAAAAIADARTCEAELTRRGVEYTVGESISEGDCGVLRPIDLDRLSSGVLMSQPTQLLCRSALALEIWMTTSVVPAAKTQFPDDTLSAFRHASTYVCRSRSSGSRISEHARGSAIDIADFGFASGRRVGVEAQEKGSPEQAFQRSVREGACGPFKTVLGPGTDADHATHFHLDIAARRRGGTYCK